MSCSIDGCGRDVEARGYCKPHYNKWYQQSLGYERVNELMSKPLRSDSLCLPDISPSLESNLVSLVRGLPGKKGL